jgi:hypothetical protein
MPRIQDLMDVFGINKYKIKANKSNYNISEINLK